MNGQIRRNEWTKAKAVAAGFVATFLTIQLLVPLAMLGARGGVGQQTSGELPLSWQMYTAVPPLGELVLTMRNGPTEAFEAVRALGMLGSRLAYDTDVLKAGCSLEPLVAQVSITIVGHVRTVQC